MVRILAVGYCPSQMGGVAVIMRRMGDFIKDSAENLEYEIRHPGACGSAGCQRRIDGPELARALVGGRYRIVCFYRWPPLKMLGWILLSSLFSKAQLVFSIRNDRFEGEYRAMRRLKRLAIRAFFWRVNWVHAINPDTNTLFVDEAKVVSFSGYITPGAGETDKGGLPSQIVSFQRRHDFNMVCNASTLRHLGGVDLYGLDLCVDLMRRLVQERQDVGLVFVVVEVLPESEAAFMELERSIREDELAPHFLLWRGPVPFPALADASDLVLRPTTTDGDSNTIREALDLGRFAVASDAVRRPAGTRLFKNRDPQDFHSVVGQAITDWAAGARADGGGEGERNGRVWVDFWRRVASAEQMPPEWRRSKKGRSAEENWA